MHATRRTLPDEKRAEYIRAVQCLMHKPPVTSKVVLPGVTSHYEDFLGAHIAQTTYVHFVVRMTAVSPPSPVLSPGR